MSLAGGMRRGDEVLHHGKLATVMGPPRIAAAAKVSVGIRYTSGHAKDVRVSELELVGEDQGPYGAVSVTPQPAFHAPSALADDRPLPRPQTGAARPWWEDEQPAPAPVPPAEPRPVQSRAQAPSAEPSAASRIAEHVTPPQKYVSGNYPTKNFIKYVIEKEPSKDEADSPDIQTIIRDKADYRKQLPTDPVQRQKEIITIYTTEGQLYPQMNLALRQDDAKRLKYFGAYIKELREIFYTDKQDQIIEAFEGTVWRGITVPDVDQFLQEYSPESEFVWEAFTSTTADRQIALTFGNVTFEIHCRPPVTGSFDDDDPEYAPALISSFSDLKVEAEVLFPPNVRFRVITVQKPTKENRLMWPMIVCETLGYDSIWGLIDSHNHDEVVQWCKQHEHLVNSDGFSHSILHAAADAGTGESAHELLKAGANGDQICPQTGLTVHEKLANKFGRAVRRASAVGGLRRASRGSASAFDTRASHPEDRNATRHSLTASMDRGDASDVHQVAHAHNTKYALLHGQHQPHPHALVSPHAPFSHAAPGGYPGTQQHRHADRGSQTHTASAMSHHHDDAPHSLAGGFRRGDRVDCGGRAGIVHGAPARRALARMSIAVKFDDGTLEDVRVSGVVKV